MKIRDGFVSNSSSSSFIVALDKIPKSKKEVKEIFYKNYDKSLWISAEQTCSTNELSNQLWKDIKSQKPTKSLKKITDVISSGYFIEGLEPDSDDYVDKGTLKGWKQYAKVRDQCAEHIAKIFMLINKKRHIYIFHYGDESGNFFGHLEHGDTFENVKHITISHH